MDNEIVDLAANAKWITGFQGGGGGTLASVAVHLDLAPGDIHEMFINTLAAIHELFVNSPGVGDSHIYFVPFGQLTGNIHHIEANFHLLPYIEN